MWWVFAYGFITNFLLTLTVKKILKIGQYLVKLWARVRCLVFFDSRCIFTIVSGGAADGGRDGRNTELRSGLF